MKETIWIEKYRPKEFNEVIGFDTSKIESFIKKPVSMPNFLFYGPAGTGKTTVARIIINKLGCDVLYLNASDDNNVDNIRRNVKRFVSSLSSKKDVPKIVFLDEADFLSKQAQAVLRGMMEEYYSNARFILTCNYVNKLMSPIRSRCAVFKFDALDKQMVKNYIISILNKENISFDSNSVDILLNRFHPDLRRIIGEIQICSINRKLNLKINDNKYIKIFNLLANDKFYKARELWINDSDFVLLSKNIFWSILENKEISYEKKKLLLIEIAEIIYRLGFCNEQEIVFSGGMLKLLKILKLKQNV